MTTMTRLAMAAVTAMAMVACGGEPAPELTALQVTPATVSLEEGASAPVTVIATWSDGTTQDVTSQVAWESADGSVAACSEGSVAGYASGATQLTARWNGLTATAEVQVAPVLAALFGLAPSPSVPGAIVMMGLFSDGSIQPVELVISWSSSASNVLVISESGALTAVAPGLTTIRANIGGLLFAISVRVNGDLSITIGG